MAALLILALLLARTGTAAAHAFLDHADPRVGSTVTAPPALTLVFTEPVEPAFSRIGVTGAGGKVETGSLAHPEPATLSIPLPPLAPGTYTVTWVVVSIDTHPTEGRFTFTVRGP
ncbi:MAG TPA: copper resistance protein CopC [Candidatus Binatia bacterium]|nr:copper resistance protein CopC [Candidatus Binatia bacterium]